MGTTNKSMKFLAKSATIDADNFKQVLITVEDPDRNRILEDFSVLEIIEYYGESKLLKGMDIEEVKAELGLVEPYENEQK